RDLGLFNPDEHGLADTMNRFEHWWRVPVQVILLLFGFTNAGVALSHAGQGTWIVMLSLWQAEPAKSVSGADGTIRGRHLAAGALHNIVPRWNRAAARARRAS
ncbi:MAG: hypothetical protein HY315_01145, partial [Acidobacteria bacterium]|nr:hypothetical protein [Acidobacteriota bacterium]